MCPNGDQPWNASLTCKLLFALEHPVASMTGGQCAERVTSSSTSYLVADIKVDLSSYMLHVALNVRTTQITAHKNNVSVLVENRRQGWIALLTVLNRAQLSRGTPWRAEIRDSMFVLVCVHIHVGSQKVHTCADSAKKKWRLHLPLI